MIEVSDVNKEYINLMVLQQNNNSTRVILYAGLVDTEKCTQRCRSAIAVVNVVKEFKAYSVISSFILSIF